MGKNVNPYNKYLCFVIDVEKSVIKLQSYALMFRMFIAIF